LSTSTLSLYSLSTTTMAIISRLIPAFVSAFGFQAICASIAVPKQEDRVYDLAGSIGFLSTTAVSLYYPSLHAKYIQGSKIPLPALGDFAPRQLLLSAALGIWSLRLGSYLASRAIKAGGDSRFDEVKGNPPVFTAFWVAQAVWVFFVGLPVYMVNSLPTALHAPLGPRDYAAFGLFASSFLLEVIADQQKSNWRKAKDNKEHDEKFITKGLWGISRHPNYVGEVGIWAGIWALSFSSLRSAYFPRYAPYLTLISPLTTYTLVRYVSGVPPLEESSDKKFGNDPKYQEYKRKVGIFWPNFGFRK